jgi:hypothetical protein
MPAHSHSPSGLLRGGGGGSEGGLLINWIAILTKDVTKFSLSRSQNYIKLQTYMHIYILYLFNRPFYIPTVHYLSFPFPRLEPYAG